MQTDKYYSCNSNEGDEQMKKKKRLVKETALRWRWGNGQVDLKWDELS